MENSKLSTKKRQSVNNLIILMSIFYAVMFFSSKSSADSDSGELLMVVGEQRVIDANNIASFSEGTRGIIEVKIPKNGKSLVLTAVRPGTTTLLLIDEEGEQKSRSITVFEKKPETIINEISSLIGDDASIKFVRIGPKVFIDGNVDSEQGLLRIEKIKQLYEGQVQSLVQVGRAVRKRTNIRLDLTFVEMDSSFSVGGGINWPKELGTGGVVEFTYDLMTGVPAATYSVVNQAVPTLQAAQTKGIAKIKKKAYLVTTNGNEATYSSGGEINIPIAGSQAAELRSISYGCTIKVLPRLDAESGMIDLEIEAEVSELTETNQDAPGRTVSKVSTLVHLGLGQSIVLSGLNSETQSRSKTGIPGLSGIPIIGLLFGTHKKRMEKTTGLVAITPVVIDNVDRDSRRQIDEALKKFSKF
ncbi:MAG: pilus assembly protein N-terminal domain-containing protein [Deltaproteobacteria bacterium]|nr:pilus assembly protein N-terminal domain-containing protein [Deltaproteobacteria bacterium]